MTIVLRDDLNFLLTNRVPRRTLTRLTGWFSRIEQPLIRDLSLRVWGFFADLDLSDASKTSFRSMHDCFTRELKPDARPVETDSSVVVSPCDASFTKGEEMGWFEHGSTIVVFAPQGFSLSDGVAEGTMIRMGQPLLRMPAPAV